MEPTSRGPLWISVALLPVAAISLWGASELPWGVDTRTRPGTSAVVTADVPGAQVAPALVPVALLALAAVAGVVALGGPARRALGPLLVAAGAFPAWWAVDSGVVDWGPALAALGGALMAAAGALVLLRGHRMPRMGGRYRAPGAAKASARREPDLWQSLTEGDDPTDRER